MKAWHRRLAGTGSEECLKPADALPPQPGLTPQSGTERWGQEAGCLFPGRGHHRVPSSSSLSDLAGPARIARPFTLISALLSALLLGVLLGLIFPPTSPPIVPVQSSSESYDPSSHELSESEEEKPPPKMLIFVTGTYNRPFQAMYLTRIAHKLLVTPKPVLWVVVEDGPLSPETESLLKSTGLQYSYLATERHTRHPRDPFAAQRNIAINWIAKRKMEGIVYFASEDRVFSVELIQELRKVRRFGAWPIAHLFQGRSSVGIEGPVCDEEGSVTAWRTHRQLAPLQLAAPAAGETGGKPGGEGEKRVLGGGAPSGGEKVLLKVARYHAGAGGYAFNASILWDRRLWRRRRRPIPQFPIGAEENRNGVQESEFVEMLVDSEDDMEGLAELCRRVLVWHVPLEAPAKCEYPKGWVVNGLGRTLGLRSMQISEVGFVMQAKRGLSVKKLGHKKKKGG